MKNENGSILISALLFISVSAIFVTGLAVIIQKQVSQLDQIQESYQVRSMLHIAESKLNQQLDQDPVSPNSGTIVFNKGRVTIEQQTDTQFELKAVLDSGFSLDRIIKVSAAENPAAAKKETRQISTE